MTRPGSDSGMTTREVEVILEDETICLLTG